MVNATWLIGLKTSTCEIRVLWGIVRAHRKVSIRVGGFVLHCPLATKRPNMKLGQKVSNIIPNTYYLGNAYIVAYNIRKMTHRTKVVEMKKRPRFRRYFKNSDGIPKVRERRLEMV